MMIWLSGQAQNYEDMYSAKPSSGGVAVDGTEDAMPSTEYRQPGVKQN